MTWILTYTGKHFDLLDPQPDMVCIEDIAHSLSNLCRFNGHTEGFYSVAQHSVNVMKEVYARDYLAPRRLLLTALLHDAAEAYIGDLSSPLKKAMKLAGDNSFRAIEAKIKDAVRGHFNLLSWLDSWTVIHEVDLDLLATEASQLLNADTSEWNDCGKPIPTLSIRPLNWLNARRQFLYTYKQLIK